MTRPQKKEKLETPDFLYIDTAAQLHDAIHRLRQQPTSTSRTIDTETTGVQPFVHRLKVIQIGVPGLPVYVVQIERIAQSEWGPLREYLAEPIPNILQNAKFDLKMLSAEGLPLAGPIVDTLLRSKIYHLGNRKINHKLELLADYWCDLIIDKTEQKSFVADESYEPLNPEQRNYAAVDISATTKVETELTKAIQGRQLKRPGIVAHVAREESFLTLLAKLENQGVLVDPVAVEALATAIKATMEWIEAQLSPILQPNLQQLKLQLGRKPAFTPSQLIEEQVIAAFQLENAETKTLLRAVHKPPLVKLVLQHESLWRQLDACAELLKKRNSHTGRWHPDHAQIENLQGSLGPSKLKIELLERLTESWQQEPLSLLQPDEGCRFLKVSFPDLELILLAHYSKDPTLLQELAGESPIEILAASIATAGLSVESYTDTFLARALWWGVGVLNQKSIYLQSWCFSELGLILNAQQTKALQSLIPQKYARLAAFQARVGNSDFKLRSTILGAIRLGDESSPKDLRNFYIWSSFSELLKLAASALEPYCSVTNSRVAFMGEQSLLLEVPEAQGAALTEAVLTTLVEQFSLHCPAIAVAIEVTALPK